MFFFFSSRRRHTRYIGDWSSDVCSSDLDVFQRISLVAQTPDLHLLFCGQAIKVSHLNAVLQDDLKTITARQRVLTTEFGESFDEFVVIAARLEHQKLAIRLALFLEIAIHGDLSIAQYQK